MLKRYLRDTQRLTRSFNQRVIRWIKNHPSTDKYARGQKVRAFDKRTPGRKFDSRTELSVVSLRQTSYLPLLKSTRLPETSCTSNSKGDQPDHILCHQRKKEIELINKTYHSDVRSARAAGEALTNYFEKSLTHK